MIEKQAADTSRLSSPRGSAAPVLSVSLRGLLLLLLLGDLRRAELLLLLPVLAEALHVLVLQLPAQDHPVARRRLEGALALDPRGRDQALDLGRLGALVGLAPDDELPDV